MMQEFAQKKLLSRQVPNSKDIRHTKAGMEEDLVRLNWMIDDFESFFTAENAFPHPYMHEVHYILNR